MQVTQLVADELGLEEFEESKPSASIDGVTSVELLSNKGNFRVHLVRDANETSVSLEEGSKLAAFYNSRFWHELVAAEKLRLNCATFHSAFQIADDDANHSVFVTTFASGASRDELGLADLLQVSEEIARVHAANAQALNKEFVTAVQENYENIVTHKRKLKSSLVDILSFAVNKELAVYFRTPTEIIGKVKMLIADAESRKDEESDTPKVVCHGKLTAENCRFGADGRLVEITEWENVHLGNPAKDLTNLIVSSADPTIRRRQFMKLFHAYFYVLVDLRPPKYQLADLKTWFRENHTDAILSDIERLLEVLSESDDEELKRRSAHRWETALDDAVDFITGNYFSDDLQTFFSCK